MPKACSTPYWMVIPDKNKCVNCGERVGAHKRTVSPKSFQPDTKPSLGGRLEHFITGITGGTSNISPARHRSSALKTLLDD